eukprot:6491675-Amphidinium_carterae.1
MSVGDIEELSQQANIPRQLKQPAQPTKQEHEEHRITHMLYRSWCPSCVKAKGQPIHTTEKVNSTYNHNYNWTMPTLDPTNGHKRSGKCRQS